MGGATSQYISTVTESWTNPEVVPKTIENPKHDPMYGFKEERAERGFKQFVLDSVFEI